MRKKFKDYFIPHKGNDFKPYSVHSQVLLFNLLIGIGILSLTILGSNNISKDSLLADVQSTFLAQVTNEKRIDNDVPTLTVNDRLQYAAQLKAADMAEYGYFAHTSPSGKNPWYWFDKAGYNYRYAGENLAIDFYETKEVAEAWMDSPSHRKNMLNSNYTEIGIAVDTGVYKGREVAFVVQMFGTPRNSFFSQALANNLEVTQESNNPEPIDEISQQTVLGEETIFEENHTETQTAKNNNTVDTETVNDLPEETFTETVYSESEEHHTVLSIVSKLVTQPISIGKWIVSILMLVVGISIVLKIIIEIKKQHYKNVIFALLILLALGLMYVILDQRIGHIIVI